MNEFELIRRFFTRPAPGALLGVGDDCALLDVTPGMTLAVSTDMLVADRHFFADTDPRALGHKALAVNLSDLAAMGARPRWATLALALPQADPAWLEAFSDGWFALAARHRVDLVGGDTTRGPLNICVQIMGEVPARAALRRGGACAGDDIWVSGTLGDAALALAYLRGEVMLDAAGAEAVLPRLHRPEPRVELGLALRGIAHAAIDISDGLVGDLGHVLAASGVGAIVDMESLPRSAAVRACPDQGRARRATLAGGDDYELCFTAAPDRRAEILALIGTVGVGLARIGTIGHGRGIQLRDGLGRLTAPEAGGYDHFG